MDTKEAITLLQLTGGASIIAGTYMEGDSHNRKNYHFKNVLGIPLQPQDVVVVETRDTMCLVRVQAVNLLPVEVACPLGHLKHVVCKVDTTELDEVKERESRAVHQLAMSELHDRLDTFRRQLGDSGLAAVSSLLAPAPKQATADEDYKPKWGKTTVVNDVPEDAGSTR